jgi:apolipoprotein N-acyltransferase
LQMISNICVAAFTAALVFTSILQWSVTKQNMKVSSRAYLALTKITTYCPICDTGQIPPPTSSTDNNASVALFFVNSGHSPGRDIDENFTLHLDEIDDSFDFHEQKDIVAVPEHTFAQPSTEFPFQITRALRAEFILEARGQIPVGPSSLSPKTSTPMYVFGHVSYTDVFEDRHTLLYCIKYHPPTNVSPQNWEYCHKHNGEYDGEYDPNKKF